MTDLDRRSFLKATAATAAAGATLGGPFQGFLAGTASAANNRPDFRQLRPVADQRDGAVRLWLPRGFEYRSFHDTEFPEQSRLDSGEQIPGRHDGMGAFPGGGDGMSVLVRNHEINGATGAFGSNPSTTYDPAAPGGTTTVVTTNHGVPSSAVASLTGTQMNCSGGVMPWGSWISCEETVNGVDVGDDFTRTPRGGTDPGPYTYIQNAQLHERHGFIFEVPSRGLSDGQPVTSAGRFAHESVVFDPHEGALYLTEDNFAFPSGFYRYVPPRNPMETGRLADGGRLQMLKVKGQWNANLAASQPQRATYQVEWVDIEDPAPDFGPPVDGRPNATNDEALTYVGNQGRAQGAAMFSRLEGTAFDRGVVYFCSTQGGGAPETGPDQVEGYGNGWGQIWAYHTRSQMLQLIYESPSREELDFPDKVTTSPSGTLVVCEDSRNDNYLRGLNRDGRLWDIALNRLVSSVPDEEGRFEERYDDEFAGSTFSADGGTLFVNVQASRGVSFAIWGPWRRMGV